MHRSSTKILLLAVTAAATLATTAGAVEGPSLVELVVVVHQDELPVEGLAAADFEVRQSGRAASVVAAERVTDRQWMLLFDLASPGSEWVGAARAAALELVAAGLVPTDRVGVAVLGADDELRVLQPTRDRTMVEQAIAAVPDSLGGVLGPTANDVASVAQEALADGGGLGEGHERGRAHTGQARIESLAQSVQGLAGLLHAFGGNNHVILLSSGVDASVAMGNDLTAALDRERATREAEASATGDVALRSDQGFARGGVVEQIVLRATEEAVRRGCSVHGVEFETAAGGARSGTARGVDGLWFLAERTGGEVVRDPESLVQDLSGLLKRTSAAYRLTVRPAKLRKAGGFHPLKIKLVDSAYEVVAPTGFYAAGGSS